MQHNSAVRTIILNFLNANKLSNNAFKEDAKFSAKQMLTLLAGDASQANLDHCQELAEFLTENGGTIEFSNTVTAQNSLDIDSVGELEDFISSENVTSIDNSFVQDQQQVTAKAKFLVSVGLYCNVHVIQKLSPNYEVSGVTSFLSGFTLGIGWELQSPAPVSISGNVVTVNVTGTRKYYIVIEGLGEIFSETVEYQIKLNKTNGNIISATRSN